MDFINYSKNEVKLKVKEVGGFGAYFILENFIQDFYFDRLVKDFQKIKKDWKKHCNLISDSNIGGGNDRVIGGDGAGIDKFSGIMNQSNYWKMFIKTMYSKEFKRYVFDIWEDTKYYEEICDKYNIKTMGCKISMQTRGYGWPIHQDGNRKVISFLLYLGKMGWTEDSKGGTDFYRVSETKVDWDKSEKSMDYQMRRGQFSHKKASLNKKHVDYLEKFESVEFKPNRLVGFIKTNTSYHSIPKRELPKGITRDCFQINVWNLKTKRG